MGLFKPNVEKMEAKRDVRGLIKALKDKHWDVRIQAEKALGKIGDPKAVEPLIEAIGDTEVKVRVVVVRTLGMIGNAKTVDALIQALGDNSEHVRIDAAKALGKIGDARAVEALIQTLGDNSEHVRIESVRALRWMGDARVLDPLIRARKDGNKYVREAAKWCWLDAAGALGKLKDVRAVDPLTRALLDEDKHVRAQAAEVLGKLEDVRAIDPLLQVIEDKSEDVRRSAALALAGIGPAAKSAAPALTKALEDNSPKVREASARALAKIGFDEEKSKTTLVERLKDSDAKVRKAAAAAIGGELGSIYTQVERLKTGSQDAASHLVEMGNVAVPALVETLSYQGQNSGSVRKEAVEALGEIKDERAVEPLIQILADEDKNVRVKAVEALGKIKDVRAIGPLIQVLNIGGNVNEKAVEALVRIGQPAVEPLVQALQDEYLVRRLAAEALEKLHWKPGDDSTKALFLLAKEDWDALVELGQPAVEHLLKALQDEDMDLRQEAARALGNMGDVRGIVILLECMFANPGHSLSKETETLLKLVPISALTTEMINVATKVAKFPTSYPEGAPGWGHFLKDSNEAVKTLCSIKSPAASNILHLVAKRRDINVWVSFGCSIPSEFQKVNFEEQREMALNELARRGSPPYNPSAFLKP